MLGPLQWLETVFHSDDVALGYRVSQKGLTLCISQLLKLTALLAIQSVCAPAHAAPKAKTSCVLDPGCVLDLGSPALQVLGQGLKGSTHNGWVLHSLPGEDRHHQLL